MSHRRPDDPPSLNGRRALVLLASTAVFVATLFGWIAQQSQPQQGPTDGGTTTTTTSLP